MATALRRSHGRIEWLPSLAEVHDTVPAVLRAGSLAVRIQLLDHVGYAPWPTEVHALEQRYRDAPPASLRVPTVDAFAAWKTVAWYDRKAPRDRTTCGRFAGQGAITSRAADLFATHGPTGHHPPGWLFSAAPDEDRWRDQLSNQTRLTVSAAEALRVVAAAWAAVTPHPDPRQTGPR